MHRLQWTNARELTKAEQAQCRRAHPRAWRSLELVMQVEPGRVYIHPPDWGLDKTDDPPAFHGCLMRREGDRAVGVHRF